MSTVSADNSVRRCTTESYDAAVSRSASAVTIDIERLSNNSVRLIEQGCKAIAACLKAPAQSRVDEDTAGEIIGVDSTFGRVAQYWWTHPHRAIELQTNLEKPIWTCGSQRPNVSSG